MYNSLMNSRQVAFSRARESLTSILDRIEKTGEPVTIVRRGKPSAVIISQHMFEGIQKTPERSFRLAGSIQSKDGVDVDAALRKGRKALAKSLKKRMSSL